MDEDKDLTTQGNDVPDALTDAPETEAAAE